MEASDAKLNTFHRPSSTCFNEAEAWKPRMADFTKDLDEPFARFNEAEAWKPRMQNDSEEARPYRQSFNEAEAWKPRMPLVVAR